jgi:hypothetical protein
MSIKEVNGGATPVETTITNSRFCTEDEVNPGTTYPLVKPEAAATNYSYKKTVFLNADTSPSGTINNVKFYPAGAIGWTGVTVEVKAVDTYTEPTGTPEVTGDDNNGTDIATYSSGSPLALTGSIDNPNTGKVSQYLELQAVLADTAVAGTLDPETCTFRYDET